MSKVETTIKETRIAVKRPKEGNEPQVIDDDLIRKQIKQYNEENKI